MHDDLGSTVRAWRERLSPAAAGLPAGGARRTPGLRREELASLAGISVDYLIRLEQGRAVNPSSQVLASLARALRLTPEERDHLYRQGGHAPPSRRTLSASVGPASADTFRMVRGPEATAEFERSVVADLRMAAGRYPDDARVLGLINDLRRASPRFCELWSQHQVAARHQDRKTINHPEVGLLTLDCDVLTGTFASNDHRR
jgi:transcriptional regulator with XRE-family HTH domain